MAKKKSAAAPPDLFTAAWTGDVERVKSCLAEKPDLTAVDKYGFTALHRAASADGVPVANTLSVLRLLLDAGSPLEAVGGGGRTALYLAAEFAHSPEPVELLLAAGADPDVRSQYGVHVVENAQSQAVKALLDAWIGLPPPEPPPVTPPPVKLSLTRRRLVGKTLTKLFAGLEAAGLVVLRAVGTTQEDGFADCSERFRELGGAKAGYHGLCFYSKADVEHSKATGHLSLSFWGAPRGSGKDMVRVGKQIVEAFRAEGFEVAWDGTGGTRPVVDLHTGELKPIPRRPPRAR